MGRIDQVQGLRAGDSKWTEGTRGMRNNAQTRLLPVRGFIRLRRRLWPRVNVRLAPKCQGCGYSLAGLAGQGVSRCPECGRDLYAHEFAGLYRIRGKTAWIVSACGPLILASPFALMLVRSRWASGIASDSDRVRLSLSAMVIVGAGSAAMVAAMARLASVGKPLLIRGTNWQGAMMSIALLGVLLAVALIAVTSAPVHR